MSDLRVGAPSASLRPGGGWGTGCRAAGSPRSERRPGVDPAAGRGDVDGRIWAPGGCERGRADDRRGWWDPSGRRTEGTDRVLNCLEAEPFDSGGGGREGGRMVWRRTAVPRSPASGLGQGVGLAGRAGVESGPGCDPFLFCRVTPVTAWRGGNWGWAPQNEGDPLTAFPLDFEVKNLGVTRSDSDIFLMRRQTEGGRRMDLHPSRSTGLPFAL